MASYVLTIVGYPASDNIGTFEWGIAGAKAQLLAAGRGTIAGSGTAAALAVERLTYHALLAGLQALLAEDYVGALTIAAAVHIHEVDAAVCLYGIPPKDFADPAKIRVPFQGHFANQDDWCTRAAVDDLERTLKAAGVKHEIYRYEAAHAFANERSAAYDVACANQAWDRMSIFLKANMA